LAFIVQIIIVIVKFSQIVTKNYAMHKDHWQCEEINILKLQEIIISQWNGVGENPEGM